MCDSPVEDYERNDGSKERPYFMSNNLKKLLGVGNRFSDTDGGEGTDGTELASREVPAGERLQLQPVDSAEM